MVRAADFFRPGRDGSGKRLVPEAVFAAYLALGFELLGWQADRETQLGAGRTDLLLRWNGSRQRAIAEVKIWGRNDYLDVQRQVESYWTSDVEAGAVVMISPSPPADWPAVYRDRCLRDRYLPSARTAASDTPAHEVPGSPAGARFHRLTARSAGTGQVDHFLLGLAGR